MNNRKPWKEYIPFPIFFLAGLLLMLKPVADLDEIWNYGFARYICDGMLPYADFNMVQTPLSAWVAAVFLGVFGEHLAVFRVLGAVLFAITFGLVHLLLLRLTDKSVLAFTAASFFAAVSSLIWMYNYNHLNLLILLIILNCELRLEQRVQGKKQWQHFLVGLLYGLTPIIKQSTGAVLLAYLAGSCIAECLLGNKDRKQLLFRMSGAMIPGVLFVGSLLANGSIQAFLDYAVIGVGTFTHRRTWIAYVLSGPIDFAVGLFPVVVTMLSVYVLVKRKSRVGRKFHLKALLLCWAGAFVVFPICDFVHMCVAVIPFLIPLFCCVGEIRISGKESILCCAVASMVLSCPTLLNVQNLPLYKSSELSCFAGLPIRGDIEEQIIAVEDYVLDASGDGVEVILAYEGAAAYMLPIDRYYKDFNLLLVGNVGTQTVEQLLWRENAVYLVVRSDEMLGNQAHRDLIAYIKNNYEKIGEVSSFDAYTPK